ncbi:hypothetical protein AB4Y45_32610 [Paraburkholderia sp. EG287A]|uniref:hypothetical protein n=1 Tax=Paraburkholderia sp. EG287A TaxID=3237012 RepID=UPI0034D23AA3
MASEVETRASVTPSPGKQATYLRWLVTGLPHGLFLLVCAAAAIAAQVLQPDIELLNILGVPKWAGAVGWISFFVVVICGFAQAAPAAISAIALSFMMLFLQPWMSFLTTILQPDGGGPFLASATALQAVIFEFFTPVFCAFVPLAFALGLITAQFRPRKSRRK